jgi:uncharacterized protein
MRKITRKIFAAGAPKGDPGLVQHFARAAADANADAVILLGGLKDAKLSPRSFGEVLKALSASGLPSFYIPGPEDSPLADYLREAADFEVVFPQLHGVHGTFAFAPGYVVVAGLGGAIDDSAESMREENLRLNYPGWELQYRLKFLRELRDYPKIFLFSNPPAHKGHAEPGSTTIAEMIKTYNPRVVVAAGPSQRSEVLAQSLVVFPGSLERGQFSVFNFTKPGVEHLTIDDLAKKAA